MNTALKLFFLLLIVIFGISVSIAQSESLKKSDKVLIIGEEGGAYEELISSCPDMLFAVAGNSMEEAFSLWSGLLQEMQDYSEEVNFELSGIKMWVNVFWNEDGSIFKIVYYPKPTSKNMDFQLLSDFLNDFAQTYVLPKEHIRCFSHYGSASFPLFATAVGSSKN